MITRPTELCEGVRRKADAHTLLADHREAVVRRAQRALLMVLLETGSATADDVRELVELPPGIGPKCFGAVPTALVRAGIIYRHGYAPTCRPTAHARPVSVWAMLDADRARRWLADHPDLPHPVENDQGNGKHQAVLFPIHQKTATPTGGAVGAAL